MATSASRSSKPSWLAFRAPVARAVATALIGAARAEGCSAVRLVTLEEMTSARSLYRSLGFLERATYYGSALPGLIYMELAQGAATALR